MWEWANDPTVRATAFSTEPIAWEDHVIWFSRKLQDPDCYIFVAAGPDGESIGQVRFDVRDGAEAEIDVSVEKSKRGLGYGDKLIRAGVDEIFRISPVRRVRALVKADNPGSARAFEKAGFQKHQVESLSGAGVYHYIRTRSDHGG